MNDKIEVLDYGYVRLVDSMGDDLSVVRSARVSYDADWRTGDEEGKDRKLIDYLIRNRHTSPFESVTFTFEVKAPIFVLRQWHRHRTWSYNEISARYSELPEEFYVPDRDVFGVQSEDNKQMRDMKTPPYEPDIIASFMYAQNEQAFTMYRELIKMEVPRELARTILPVATYSKMFATVDLHNLFHFLKLRLHEHAQYEIRVYAEAMLDLIEDVVPVSVEAWRKHIGNE